MGSLKLKEDSYRGILCPLLLSYVWIIWPESWLTLGSYRISNISQGALPWRWTICISQMIYFYLAKVKLSKLIYFFKVSSSLMIYGLQANKSRSALYYTSMAEDEIARVVQFSDFVKDNLPYRYIGVLISFKNLKATYCEALAEKMILKIKLRSTRKLSFARKAPCQFSAAKYT